MNSEKMFKGAVTNLIKVKEGSSTVTQPTSTTRNAVTPGKPALVQSESMPPLNNKDITMDEKTYSKTMSSPNIQVPNTPPSILSYSLSKDFINLTMLSNELGASNSSLGSMASRTTSFSGISHAINSLLKSYSINHTKVPNGLHKDICDAIDVNNTTLIKSLLNDRISPEKEAIAELISIRSIEKHNVDTLNLVLNNHLSSTIHNNLLFVCVEYQSLECCRVLLRHGLSPNTWRNNPTPTANDVTPLHYATRLGHLNCLEVLCKEGNGNLNIGVDETSQDGEELSLLHTAAKYNQPEIVEYLLENKVNKMGGKKKFSATPLHVAAELNHYSCAKLLLDQEVLVDALKCSKKKETALHLAAQNGYVEVAAMLIRNSANVNAVTGTGETSLHFASKCLSPKLMTLLIEHGADVNAQDNDGRPPLHCVVLSKNKGATECMRILLRHGADSSLSDNTNRTALHLAAMEQSQNRVNVLIEAGADVSAKMDHGRPALFFIMKYCPSSITALEKRLDTALSLSNEDNDNCEVRMDFTSLIPKKLKRKPNHEKPYSTFHNSNGNSVKSVTSEVSFFKEVLLINTSGTRNLSEKIILHPLSQVTYSLYAVLIYKTLCPTTRELPANQSSISSVTECVLRFYGEQKDETYIAVLCWILLVLFTILHIIVTVTKIIHYQKRSIADKEIILNTLIIISFFLITFHSNPLYHTEDVPCLDENLPCFASKITLGRYQYHAAGIGVALTWLMQMYFLAKVPRFGKYIEMFTSVSLTFLNLLFAFIFFLFAFTLSFYILFPGYDAFDTALPAVLVKVLVMMLGELEYEDIYYPQKDTINLTIHNNTISGVIEDGFKTQYFPFTAHVVLLTFIIFVSIIVMNLLFGLAVTDVQELRKTAKLQQLKQQVEVISYMESVLFSPLYHRLPGRAQRWLTDNFCFHTYVRTFQPNNFQDVNSKQLTKSLKSAIYQRCIQLQKQRSGRLTDSQKIERLVNDMQLMKNMVQMLLKQNSIPIPTEEINPKSYQSGENIENTTRKFSMNSLTHQFSMEGGDDTTPYPSERDEDFTKLIEKNSFDIGGMFSAASSRKVSKISQPGLAYIQEEESSIDRRDSADFDSYSGDSNI